MAETRPRFEPTSPIPQRDAPVELRNSDELLAKLTDLHRQTEKHDELLGVYETLHDSVRRFREMIDALPAAIYTTDAEGHLTHFNAAAVELSGRTPELGTDQWCVNWKLFWPDGTPMRHDECPMAVALKEGRILDGVEAIAERPDGTRFWFTPYPRLLRDAEGRITGGINMLLDITGRKEAERASSLLAAIVDSSDDAIISKSLDGVITSWNKSAERLFGYTAEEAIGQHITLIVPPDRLHEEATIIARLKRGERIDHFETIRRCKDGTLLNISLTISPVKDSAGRVIGASKVARDVTERKRTEAALRKSEERARALADKLEAEVRARTEELERRNTDMLEQAEQLRSLSNRLMQLQDDERRRIARELHDSVGQDLAALSMCLEGAKRTAKGTPGTAAQKLDEACEIVDKCSSDIRTLSHLLHPPLLEELGLASAIKWYVEGFASRSKIEVNLQMPPGFKRMEPAIELPLFRVLQECLTNIHRHSESKTATVKVEADERKVSLEVSDQGKGLPKRDATLGSGKRLGVGINGMRERLKDLGGTLELYSTNQGTTVRAAIPLRADARAATN
ncbi:MAG: sensor histidine kinase [Candidatus Acidiferrales bacterium]